jgi:hypothetical protein
LKKGLENSGQALRAETISKGPLALTASAELRHQKASRKAAITITVDGKLAGDNVDAGAACSNRVISTSCADDSGRPRADHGEIVPVLYGHRFFDPFRDEPIGRLNIGQPDSKPLRDGFRCFGKLGKRKTFLPPTMESAFEHPNVFDAYSFQRQRCLRTHDVPSRRTIENNVDIVWDGNPR